MSLRRFIAAAAFVLAACGGDSTGPATLSGSWQYSARNLSSSLLPGLTCEVSGMSVTLAQNGSTFAGSTTAGILHCVGLGSESHDTIPQLQVTEGVLDGNAVTFRLGSSDPGMEHIGVWNANTISGTVSMPLLPFGTLNGTFTLEKK